MQAGQAANAINSCSEALRIKPSDLDTLCERGDAHLNNENFSEGNQISSAISHTYNFNKLFECILMKFYELQLFKIFRKPVV